jgi:hypothetical protein
MIKKLLRNFLFCHAERSRSISTASAKPFNEAMEMLRSAQHDRWGVVTKFHKQL